MSSPRENVKDILGKMGITKVYHIDDGYEGTNKVGLEQLLAKFSSINPEELKRIFEIKEKDFVADEDIDKTTLRELWEELEYNEKSTIIPDIDDSFVWDIKALAIVENLFEEDLIDKKTPEAWEKSKDTIIEEARGNKILFLFDKDWGEGKGMAGIEAIRDLLQTDNIPEENLLCGLFTHTVFPNEEYRTRKELADEKGIDSDKFLVISKKHKEDSFVSSLRTTALIPTLLEFKDKIKDSIEIATTAVQGDISKLDIVDLEYLVLDKSLNEGDWEPEILYRIHKNRHIKEFRNEIFTNDVIKKNIKKMREIKDIGSQKITPTDETKELMKHELYDDKINQYFCPLKSGDIFEKGSKKYILLAQPCDLMIRSKGERYPLGYRCFANLIELKNSEAKVSSSSSKLEYFSGSQDFYAHHAKVHKVEFDILDLCTFNVDGKTIIDINDEDLPHRLMGISMRYKQIHKKMKKKFDIWKDKTDGSNDVANQLFTPNGKGVLELTITKDTKIINFGLKRISRLSKDKSNQILSVYMAYHSRAASEVDLG